MIRQAFALLSGAFGLVLAIFTAVMAALDRPLSPRANLVAISCAALISFIVAGVWVMVLDRRRAEAAEQKVRDLRRAEERPSFNVPTGLKLGHLQRLIFEARTPDLLDEQSSKLLAEMIEHCIAGLNDDTRFIIEREKSSRTFGPFAGLTARYRRRLRWLDAQAEVTRLRHSGMVEAVPGNPAGRFRWTPSGLAVIGKLGLRH